MDVAVAVPLLEVRANPFALLTDRQFVAMYRCAALVDALIKPSPTLFATVQFVMTPIVVLSPIRVPAEADRLPTIRTFVSVPVLLATR
jgi:hypothetical protein